MQAVVAIPEIVAAVCQKKGLELLLRPVAGVPLLIRTLKTAVRVPADDILLICPAALPDKLVLQFIQKAQCNGTRIRVIQLSEFDAHSRSSWTALKPYLNEHFLWLPWNWVTTTRFLVHLPLMHIYSLNFTQPAYATLHEVIGDNVPSVLPHPEGVAVTSPESVVRAECFLVAHSGKVLDGIHTSFNRRLCRPFVRVLSHTIITPDAVTLGGVVISVLSGFAFARGTYWYSVSAALLFYVAGLFDEMDGMLARAKFAESSRGTWLEGFADGLSYLMLFGGMTIGLHRRYGRPATLVGIALLIGAALALITTSLQRRRATKPDHPNEYLGRFYKLLEQDSGNWISRIVRHVQAFQRRGVAIHYVILFAIIGALPLLFLLATLGSHLTWILTLYFNRRFFSQPAGVGARPNVDTFEEAV